MKPNQIATEIANLRTLEDAYRMQAREIISNLKAVTDRRKKLEQLISPKSN